MEHLGGVLGEGGGGIECLSNRSTSRTATGGLSSIRLPRCSTMALLP